MNKKGIGFQIAGIILIILQIISYTKFDFDGLFAPNYTSFDDFTYVLGQIAYFLGYSIIGIIGISLLITHEKINSPIKQKRKNMTIDKKDQKSKYKCSKCGTVVDYDFSICPNCNFDFSKNDTNNEKFICDNCGSVVKETDKACPKCGLEFEDDETIEEDKNDTSLEIKEESQEELVCSNCGHSIKDSDKKCPHCGEVFEEEQEEKVEEEKIEEKKIKEESDIDKKYKDLTKLKKLLDKEIITKEEFEKEKKKILK